MAAYPYKTVVDAVAETRALVEADTVFAEIGMASPTEAQTAQMETMIGQVSGLVDRFLDRVLASEDVTDHFRAPRGDTLRLSRWPVAEILEVIENGVSLSPSDWDLDVATGQLWRLSSGDRTDWSCVGFTTVSYVAGYDLPDGLPPDLQRAAVDQIKALFMGGARDPNLRSFSVPDVLQASFSVAGGDSGGRFGLMAQVEAALTPYRKLAV